MRKFFRIVFVNMKALILLSLCVLSALAASTDFDVEEVLERAQNELDRITEHQAEIAKSNKRKAYKKSTAL